MAQSSRTKFCTLDVPYPQSAMLMFERIESVDGDEILLFPHTEILRTFTQLKTELRSVAKYYNKERNGTHYVVDDTVTVFPLTFTRLYPLAPDFWAQPTVAFDSWDRYSAFSYVLSKWPMHELLVTPMRRRGMWQYKAAIPVRLTTPEAAVHQFMLSSTWPVNVQAKHAAFYSIGTPWLFNTRTNRREQVFLTVPQGSDDAGYLN